MRQQLDSVATECSFARKRVSDMIRTHNEMHHTDTYAQYSSIIWPVWVNG